ncbi:hypothetical protein ACJMK2_035005 [Sinanodonta woodiana]|uniref:G protein alpha subunit n=1 Tax=Sinanodonta woodiana TaxID=1069815 RepID=A0ABD3WXC9_SINWO
MQVKCVYYENEEFEIYPAVLDNLVSSMKYVLTGMGLLRINLENPKNKYHAQNILTCNTSFDSKHVIHPHLSVALKSLWQDKGVRIAVARGYEFELNDSAIYYFENMERIISPKFIPSEVDVLRARVRTTGIIETCFRINGAIFRMFDVGGQRSERRKWINCFDDVKAVLYVTALSAYDMCLLEDATVNRLEESLKLFRGICNNRFFTKASMVLFLNKVDLFQDKVKYSERHLRYFFPDFPGPDKDTDAAARYIQQLFMMQSLIPGKVIYSHFTTATDTSNIQVVFQVVMDSILRENLKAASILF